MAVSLLQNHGLEDLVELIGGMAAWEAAKLHVEGVSVEAAVA
jgi:rhodanese-related sulfurtransferase